MMNCWAVLELDQGADERSIKRSYAKLLKVNRPDEDPVAFQNLRDAYERALQLARARTVEDDEPVTPNQPLITPSPAPLQTAPIMTAIEQPCGIDWLEHVRQTDAQNLPTRHQIALDQGHSERFQQLLLAQCLNDSAQRVELIKAAFEHLRWLTVWQSIQISSYQQHALAEAIFHDAFTGFGLLIECGEYTRFLEELQALEQQPWLTELERREYLQCRCMVLLIASKNLTSDLFEQISAMFGWSMGHNVHPGPEDLWQALRDRWEEVEYDEYLRRIIDSAPQTAEAKAAHLLFKPPRLAARLRMARKYDESVWNACEHICEQLTVRYPDILQRYPEADLNAWKLMRMQSDFRPMIWVYIGAFLLELLAPQLPPAGTEYDVGTRVMMVFLSPFWTMVGFFIFICIWRPLMVLAEPADAWLSKKLLPRALSWPGTQVLILRHGIPFLFLGLFYALSGPRTLLVYLLLAVLWVVLSPYRYLYQTAPARQKIRQFYLRHTVLVVFTTVSIIMGTILFASQLSS
ncbi:Heat shock protein DnaJ [Pseudomonas syringae pv. primulae]|uniref:Heat shock protein DnaJ n=2 Tax=Pseudomonas syringae group genomosp. 3 TaxID=251701 RepID=A0A3M5TVC6_9PSED|nr:J domain-containing protein [Pseudomonas syringae group genomosp. 3]RMO79009.1 Heat shock protein DnaJ [Pseudomonas syringae pv. primulae]RMU37436.1 Heat shock protein DnaJ [Pseudomonas syringae pv. primulae]